MKNQKNTKMKNATEFMTQSETFLWFHYLQPLKKTLKYISVVALKLTMQSLKGHYHDSFDNFRRFCAVLFIYLFIGRESKWTHMTDVLQRIVRSVQCWESIG